MLAELLPKIAAMEAGERESSKYRKRPSSAGPEKCIRQMVYHGLDTKKQQTGDRMWLVFDDSSWHEELSADWIRKTAFQLHSEQMKVDVGELKGSIDGILTDITGVERLWEHKAINHFTFVMYWEGKNGSLPLDNICQSCIYCKAVQGDNPDNPDITEILLLIKNKNTAQYMEYLIEYHDDVALIKEATHSTGEKKEINQLIYFPVSYCMDKFRQVQAHIEKKTLPPRQYEMTHWRCEYCPYMDKCWEGYENEFDKLESDAALEGDIVDLCKYYLECTMHESEMKKEKDGLKKQIKDILKAKEVKDGNAGEYVLKMSLVKYEKVADMNLVPKENIKTTMSTQLRITKPKPKKKKGGENGK